MWKDLLRVVVSTEVLDVVKVGVGILRWLGVRLCLIRGGVSPDALISVIDSEASVSAAVLFVADVVDCPSVSLSAVRCDSEGCWLA